MRTCSVEGCERDTIARGWCPAHYTRWRRHSDMHAPVRRSTAPPPECRVEGCEQDAKSRGYCNRHYLRWRKYGDPGANRYRSVVPFRDRYLSLLATGEKPAEIARRGGYLFRGIADSQALKRRLGLIPMSDGTTAAKVSEDTARRLAEALHLDPVDVGL